MAVDPTNLVGSDGAIPSESSLLDDLAAHQTFWIITLLVLVHFVGIGALLAYLWNQTPKKLVLTRVNSEIDVEEKVKLQKLH